MLLVCSRSSFSTQAGLAMFKRPPAECGCCWLLLSCFAADKALSHFGFAKVSGFREVWGFVDLGVPESFPGKLK